MQNITSQIKSLQNRLDFINLEQKRKEEVEKQKLYTHIVSGCLDFDSKMFDDIDDYKYNTNKLIGVLHDLEKLQNDKSRMQYLLDNCSAERKTWRAHNWVNESCRVASHVDFAKRTVFDDPQSKQVDTNDSASDMEYRITISFRMEVTISDLIDESDFKDQISDLLQALSDSFECTKGSIGFAVYEMNTGKRISILRSQAYLLSSDYSLSKLQPISSVIDLKTSKTEFDSSIITCDNFKIIIQ